MSVSRPLTPKTTLTRSSPSLLRYHRQITSTPLPLISSHLISSHGRKTRDGVDFHSGDATGFDAGDTDAVRPPLAQATVEGRWEVVDGMDADVVHITEVFESHRNADEEGVGEHERVFGGSWSSD